MAYILQIAPGQAVMSHRLVLILTGMPIAMYMRILLGRVASKQYLKLTA